MKTSTTIILIAFLAIIAAVLFYSCTGKSPHAVEASLIIDKTEDTFLAQPDTSAIKHLLPADNEPWQGYRFRLLAISDVDYNPVQQVEILPAFEYTSNTYDRKDQTQKFFTEIDSAFEKANSTPSGKTRSSIYIPLARELNHLAESSAKRRILIIYSDLMEFSFLTDFYKKSVMQKLENQPDELMQTFEKQVPVKDLKGIEVMIVYQPRNNEESRQFDIVSKFYSNLLQSKGAKVTIGANLIL